MPTTKDRINVTIDKDRSHLLKTLAKRDNLSVSAKVLALVDDALELEEDLALATIADVRSKQKGKRYTHEEAWKGIK